MKIKAYKGYACRALLALLGVATLQGCMKDRFDGDAELGGDAVTLRVEVSVDGAANMGTRGMSDADETTIESIDVFHFVEQNGTYRAVTESPAQGSFTAGPPSWVNATLNTYPGSNSKLVILLNARKTGNYGYVRTMTLDAFLANLVVEEAGEWYDGTARPLPMYAITSAVEVKKDVTDITDSGDAFPLLRMHAKFNIRLKQPLDSGTFELVSVCVFNRNTQGFLPYAAPLDYTDGATKPKVATHNIPSTTGTAYMPGIAVPYYTAGTDSQEADYGKIINKQYVFEVNNADETDRLKKTALVIGGKYGTDTDVSYYRVDVDVTSGNILRNRLYDVEIQSVANTGYGTAEEAFIGAKNIEYTIEVIPWGENVEVELPFVLPDVPGFGTALSGKTYVGAFWKAAQTGERLIKIPVDAAGRWAVQVYEYGAGFKKGDIVFSTDASGDANIYTNSAADMIASDAAYQVAGNSIYAVGNTTKESGQNYIFFRIGLKSAWTPRTGQPVRYATALISYTAEGGNTIYQKLFLRQGEEPDYLMAPGDAYGPNADASATGNRSLAAPFSPYNLTHPTFKASAVTTQSAAAAIQSATNKDDYFTSYPTQAGGTYQWGPNYGVYAFNPVCPAATTPTNWAQTYDGSKTWSNLAATTETCPSGFRRPTDGPTNAHTASPAISGSEMRQSLWYSPQTSNTYNSDNLAWGYYADGFFDRRPLTAQPAYSNPEPNAAVSINTSHVAYIGMLFFNPVKSSANHNASIFFPAPGWRSITPIRPGYLYSTGGTGFYWTGNSYTEDDGWCLQVWTTTARQIGIARTNGYSIRCVKDDSWTPSITPMLTTDSDGRKIYTDGETYTIKVTSNTEWVASIRRGTNAVTVGDDDIIGSPLLDEAAGFDGGATNAIISGDGNGTLTVTTVDYVGLGKTTEGTLAIVFMDKTTGEILNETKIFAWDGVKWARSNVVWDDADQRLTFAVTKKGNATIPANSQGVFFQWGSLLAISPAALTGTTVSYTAAQYPGGHIVYDPTGTYTYAWMSIPYAGEATSPFDNSDTTEDDFSTYNANTGFNHSAGKGDVCRYVSSRGWVSGNWRLPTQDEFDRLIAEQTSISNGGGFTNIAVTPSGTANNHYGFYQPLSGRWLGAGIASGGSVTNPTVGVYFPAGGYRYGSDGVANYVASLGYYWSGSSNGAGGADYLSVTSSIANKNGSSRRYAYPVRCIRELE